MAKTQHYGICFPITSKSDERTLLDLNVNRAEMIKSEIMHVIFTPKGQRLRNPDFGTNLIQYIFNPSDTQTWDDIVTEIKESIKKWVSGVTIGNVELGEVDNGLGLAVKIHYSVTELDGSTGEYEIMSRL